MTDNTPEHILSSAFREYLTRTLDYPNGALLEKYLLGPFKGRLLQPDLVVVDLETSRPLAIFEYRVGPVGAVKESTLFQLAAMAGAVEKTIPAYLVTSAGGGTGFQIHRLTVGPTTKAETTEPIPLNELPSYRSLITRAATLARRSRLRTLDRFAWKCYASFVCLLVFFIACVWWDIKITTAKFYMLAAALAFLVLPDAAMLKLFGFEFQRRRVAGDRPESGNGDHKRRSDTRANDA